MSFDSLVCVNGTSIVVVSLDCDVIPANIADSLDRSVILATDDVSLDSDVITSDVVAVSPRQHKLSVFLRLKKRKSSKKQKCRRYFLMDGARLDFSEIETPVAATNHIHINTRCSIFLYVAYLSVSVDHCRSQSGH